MGALAALADSGGPGCPAGHASVGRFPACGGTERRLYLDVCEQLGLELTWISRVLVSVRPLFRRDLLGVLDVGLLVMDQRFCARVRITRHHSAQQHSVLRHVVVRRTPGCTTVSGIS